MDDCISRKAAIDALADYIHNVDKVMGTGHLTADDCKDAAASVFEELPSAQPVKEIPTCDLAAELTRREGVEKKIAEPYSDLALTVNGPAVVLVVTD